MCLKFQINAICFLLLQIGAKVIKIGAAFCYYKSGQLLQIGAEHEYQWLELPFLCYTL